jgi:CDP-diacylglycerol--glycerol-3-phosphate 3-phosphatidyltransferase
MLGRGGGFFPQLWPQWGDMMPIIDLERGGRALAEWLVRRTLARLPVTPLALTLSGTALNVAAAALLALGYLPWAGGLVLFAALFDAADGALARVTGRQSDLGAFLDSTLDRYSEMLIGLGALLYLLPRGAWPDLVLLYLFLSGSLLFSYARARAEAAGFSTHAGLFIRSVRVLLLGIGLLAGQLYIALWVLAVGVQVSALQRLVGVCGEARRKDLHLPAPVPAWTRWFRSRAERRALTTHPRQGE